MFQFHGWLRIQTDDSDNDEAPALRDRTAAAESTIRAMLPDYDDGFSWFEIRQTGNESLTLVAHGLRNHRKDAVFSLFTRVGSLFPHSFGLLYYHDDEHILEDNAFRILKIARGTATTHEDVLLSPVIPTVEEPYSFSDA